MPDTGQRLGSGRDPGIGSGALFGWGFIPVRIAETRRSYLSFSADGLPLSSLQEIWNEPDPD